MTGTTISSVYIVGIELTSPAQNPVLVTSTGSIITNGFYAIDDAIGQAGTVTNYGVLLAGGVGSSGVIFPQGGTVANSGLIKGGTGVQLSTGFGDSSGSVVNDGSIIGTVQEGVEIEDAGSVANGSAIETDRIIMGVYAGVFIAGYYGGVGTVTNFGTIGASGAAGVGVEIGTVGTVLNAGTITGAGGTAIRFYSGSDRLIVDPGAVFNGKVTAAGGGNVLELASTSTAGVISGIGTNFTGFQTIQIDPGATWAIAGAILGGTVIDLGAGADLEIEAAASQTVAFLSNTGTLQLDDAPAFTGTIADLTPSAVIDLGTVAATSAFVTNNTLYVPIAGGGEDALNITGTFVGGHVIADGQTITVSSGPLQPATATIEELSGGGVFTQTGTAYTLNLGTVPQGASPIVINLGVVNSAPAPADTLSGTFATATATGFTLAGFEPFSGLTAGSTDSAPTIMFLTGTAGAFSQTITLDPADISVSGTATSLNAEVLTITGTVTPKPAANGMVSIVQPAVSAAYLQTSNFVGPDYLELSDAAIAVCNDFMFAAPLNTLATDITNLTQQFELVVLDLVLGGTAQNMLVSAVQNEASTPTYQLSGTVLAAIDLVVHDSLLNGQGLGALDAAALTFLLTNSEDNASAGGAYVNAVAQEAYKEVLGDLPSAGALEATAISSAIAFDAIEGVLDPNGTNSPIDSALAVGSSLAWIGDETTLCSDLSNGQPQEVLTADILNVLFDMGLQAAGSFTSEAGALYGIGVVAIELLLCSPADAIAWGDVHLTTFSGLYYNFQAEGEFVLVKSTEAGNSYQIQTRLQPYYNSPSVTVMTQIGASVGTDRVTFDINRQNTVMVDGKTTTLSASNPLVKLNGGYLLEQSANQYIIIWDSGEIATITDRGAYLNLATGLAPTDKPGSVEGLLGADTGAENDFQLANGTVLPQPLTSTELYGEFANAWRVTQATSLLDYGIGQTTTTFTDFNFPYAPITLADLPVALVQQAESLAAAAGITDPNVKADAALDYILTNNPGFISGAAALPPTSSIGTTATITQTNPTPPSIGVTEAATTVTEPASGSTPVTFDVYLTKPITNAVTVDYDVIAPAPGMDIGKSAFGGNFPSGQITIAADQTTAAFSINLPAGALGLNPTGTLVVEITAPNDVNTGQTIVAPVAQTIVINNQPQPGPSAMAGLFDLVNVGTFSQTGSNYALDLGTLTQGVTVPVLQFSVGNTAAALSDELAGSFTVSGDTEFTVTGDGPLAPLDPGQVYDSLFVSVNTGQVGAYAETIVFSPKDVNASGYQSVLPSQTLTVTDTVAPAPICFLPGTLIKTPSGETPIEQLMPGDTVLTASGAHRPIVWIGTGQVLATRGQRSAATPVIIRKGALADNVPHNDLRITKAHSLYLDAALIPVEFLVNHRSILWDDLAQVVTLFHIELETHDVLLANGAPAESYRDDGNRWLFKNANAGWEQKPKPPCADVLTGGPIVDAVWERLLHRAGDRPGVPVTDDPDLHLVINGQRTEPASRFGDAHVFRLGCVPDSIRIASRAGSPQELGLARDPRCLGVALRRVVVSRGARLRLLTADDARLTDGFHEFEADCGWRWTDGDAALPADLFTGFDGPVDLTLHLCGATRYLDNEPIRSANAA